MLHWKTIVDYLKVNNKKFLSKKKITYEKGITFPFNVVRYHSLWMEFEKDSSVHRSIKLTSKSIDDGIVMSFELIGEKKHVV